MIIDLSHTIENGMTFYPGDPEPRLVEAPMDPPWHVTHITMGSHTGTHIDAARHFVPGARTIDAYPLDRFVVSARVVEATAGEDAAGEDAEIAWPAVADQLAGVAPASAVLFRTGWDQYWKSARFLHHPHLSVQVAEELVRAGIMLVGIDALNVDSSSAGTTEVHRVLLGNDVLIVENLAHLDALTAGRDYHCAFVPLRLADGDGSPIRAFAWAE